MTERGDQLILESILQILRLMHKKAVEDHFDYKNEFVPCPRLAKMEKLIDLLAAYIANKDYEYEGGTPFEEIKKDLGLD